MAFRDTTSFYTSTESLCIAMEIENEVKKWQFKGGLFGSFNASKKKYDPPM